MTVKHTLHWVFLQKCIKRMEIKKPPEPAALKYLLKKLFFHLLNHISGYSSK